MSVFAEAELSQNLRVVTFGIRDHPQESVPPTVGGVTIRCFIPGKITKIKEEIRDLGCQGHGFCFYKRVKKKMAPNTGVQI